MHEQKKKTQEKVRGGVNKTIFLYFILIIEAGENEKHHQKTPKDPHPEISTNDNLLPPITPSRGNPKG